MPALRPLAAFVVAAFLVLVVAAPAAAGDRPRVRVSDNKATQDNELALIEIEYACAAGTTATVAAWMWQGGSAEDPTTVYASRRLYPLSSDGAEHDLGMALILVGWDEACGILPTLFVRDAALCG